MLSISQTHPNSLSQQLHFAGMYLLLRSLIQL